MNAKLLSVACPKCNVEMKVMNELAKVQDDPPKHRPGDVVHYLWCVKCGGRFKPPTITLEAMEVE